MDKRQSTEGFTLIEVLVVTMFLSLLTLVFVPSKLESGFSQKDRILSDLIHTQATALWAHQSRSYANAQLEYDYPIRFTAKGMSTQAQTLTKAGQPFLVIQLGPGRIHE